MKYAIRFYRGCRIIDSADEVIIRYIKKTAELISFAQEKAPNQRLIVDVSGVQDDLDKSIDIFKAAFEVHKNFALLVNKTQDIDVIKELKIPFFFIEGAGTYDEFVSQLNQGVSDIYITNELGFALEKLSPICREKEVQIRVFPNVAQSSSDMYANSFKKFFIRPDDTEFYENYVDVFEFFGPLTKQPVLHDIYKDGRWQGNLSNIIIGLDKDIDCRTIVPLFATSRSGCLKRCTYNKCHICENIESVSKILDEKEILITRKKRIYDEPEIDGEIMQNEPAAVVGSNDEISEKTQI